MRPNILYIMSDDHAANAISCYHSILQSVFQTPNMDRLYQEGCRMDAYCATNAICTPARASIMTGQYGQLNGVRTLGDKWNPETELNLARILKENGYQTAMFGKWHLGCDPEGFDDYQYLAKEGQGMFGEQGVYFNPSFKDKNNGYVLYEGYVTDIITNLTTNWIKNRKKEIGVYNILGMEKRHIAKVLGQETFFVAVIAIAGGVLSGIVFSKLILMLLYRMLGFQESVSF